MPETAGLKATDGMALDNEKRIRRQLGRLRDGLARAWAAKSPPAVIRRLETLMRGRWKLLEKVHHQHR